jgi:hypothetical protein
LLEKVKPMSARRCQRLSQEKGYRAGSLAKAEPTGQSLGLSQVKRSLFFEVRSHDFVGPKHPSLLELAKYCGILPFGNE